MDGTLIDSTQAIYESFCYVLNKYSKPIPSIDDVCKFVGYKLEDIFSFFDVKEDLIELYCDEYKTHYTNIANIKTNMISGAIDSIKIASEFAILGVVTTKSHSSSKKILTKFGVDVYFDTIIGRENVINTKPHKEPILKAIKNIKNNNNIDIDMANIFMIGDTILDLKAAQDAQINGIGVLCGYGNKADMMKFSDKVFDNTIQAVNFIKGL